VTCYDVIAMILQLVANIKVDASYNGPKVARIPIPKVHINGKINTRMEKNIKN
jgi:hypothetical protein